MSGGGIHAAHGRERDSGEAMAEKQNLDAAMKKVLSVSRTEIQRRIAAGWLISTRNRFSTPLAQLAGVKKYAVRLIRDSSGRYKRLECILTNFLMVWNRQVYTKMVWMSHDEMVSISS